MRRLLPYKAFYLNKIAQFIHQGTNFVTADGSPVVRFFFSGGKQSGPGGLAGDKEVCNTESKNDCSSAVKVFRGDFIEIQNDDLTRNSHQGRCDNKFYWNDVCSEIEANVDEYLDGDEYCQKRAECFKDIIDIEQEEWRLHQARVKDVHDISDTPDNHEHHQNCQNSDRKANDIMKKTDQPVFMSCRQLFVVLNRFRFFFLAVFH